jgi:hypothetical protein
VNDAIAVALEVVAVGVRGFGEAASAGVGEGHRVGQHGERITLLLIDDF